MPYLCHWRGRFVLVAFTRCSLPDMLRTIPHNLIVWLELIISRFTPRGRLMVALALFISWLLFSSVLLYRFGFAHYGTFDPKQYWQFNPAGLTLSALAVPVLPGWQVVHVLDSHCGCSRLAKPHAELFRELYQLSPEQQQYLSAAELAAAGFTLPAVPAVLLFDNGKLMYAGPYASGPLCSTNNSFLTSLLSRDTQLGGLWLNGESKACRCLVSADR